MKEYISKEKANKLFNIGISVFCFSLLGVVMFGYYFREGHSILSWIVRVILILSVCTGLGITLYTVNECMKRYLP